MDYQKERSTVNTDQAFDLLKSAGVTEEVGIQTVKRWLREKKIYYAGTLRRDSGYILDNTDQAINLLKDAGVDESSCINAVRRWVREGKIKKVGSGERNTEYLPNETLSKLYAQNQTNQDKTIGQLKGKIKAQSEHIIGIEQLHKTSMDHLILQRDKLKKENAILENENSELLKESKRFLKENIELRNQLLKLKEELARGSKREPEKTESAPAPKTQDYRQKLGLSKTADRKEVLSGYKKLLKIAHPDQGGNAAVFHYIKTDYDHFRNS